ncbi:MAG: TRAP transporter substrate-binding protein DctP [Spirochaetaceae bacterium]|nr:TRAP transporter substrate-binding protein DctP [Spirochaetaceae bacterium]MDT8297882.1 TRAP transporter substrate-binding protein DctP [Spirochaetaceae bacterium]
MLKGSVRILLVFMVFAVVSVGVYAQTIKLASPLPEGTEWDTSLRRMAGDWNRITEGRVRVRIYPGGIAGGEGDMIRKMRFGQIDAGVFSAFGLKAMVPETFVVTLPGLIHNDAELDYTLDTFVGRFDERFREEGFEILAWSKTGWANLFGNQPLRTPSDLKRSFLAVDNSESEIAAAFKELGFNVVPVSLNEVMVGLQSGQIDCIYTPPVVAAAYQWFALAPHMTDFGIAPVIGGLVITQRMWSRIPEEYHEELRSSMEKLARDFYSESVRLNDAALRVMKDNGLVVIKPTRAETDTWLAAMSDGQNLMVGEGKAVPTELYEDLSSELDRFRNGQ